MANHVKLSRHLQLSLQNNVLSGLTVTQFLNIARNHAGKVQWDAQILFRVVFLLFMSILNSVGGLFDEFRYGDKIRSTKIHQSPIFVLGQPRSGTTLFHQLLALDEGFAAPKITQVAFAQSFLTSGNLVESFPLCFMLSPTRPMDNMTQTWDCKCSLSILAFHEHEETFDLLDPLECGRNRIMTPTSKGAQLPSDFRSKIIETP